MCCGECVLLAAPLVHGLTTSGRLSRAPLPPYDVGGKPFCWLGLAGGRYPQDASSKGLAAKIFKALELAGRAQRGGDRHYAHFAPLFGESVGPLVDGRRRRGIGFPLRLFCFLIPTSSIAAGA